VNTLIYKELRFVLLTEWVYLAMEDKAPRGQIHNQPAGAVH
jgi:hypothetical protein